MDNNYFSKNNRISVFIIAILILIFFVLGHTRIGSILLLLYIALIGYSVKDSKNKKKEWNKFLKEFSSILDISSKSIMMNSPFPLAIVGESGNLLWYNEKFRKILGENEILGINISDIIPDVSVDEILNQDKKSFKYVKINDDYYNIFTNINDSSLTKGKTILLYFYEVSYEAKLSKNIEENKYCILNIEVDNLDEVLKYTEEDKTVILSAEIERTIKNYAQSLKSMIVKHSSNKYVMVANYKTIEKEMEKNFDILDQVREINYGNNLTVTLSIGVGCDGETPLENYEFATAAKELALSRGGDQVVVKNKDKMLFYGGKTKEVEKRTKVRARVIGHALVNLIKESSNVFIMGHLNPDIDALGASIGIRCASKALGKESYVVLDNVNSAIEKPIGRIIENDLYDDIFISQENCIKKYNENSLIILVDVNSKNYVLSRDILNYNARIVVIDHHRKSTSAVENTLISYIAPYASSTCELVTEMIQYMLDKPKEHITKLEAEMLLAGIYVDTKNFYFKTGVRTFEAAAYLKQLGADIVDVKKMFADNLESYLKKAEIMSLAEVKDDIAIAICPPDVKDNILVAQVADELLNITGVQASFVLAKIDDEVFISGRSFGDINVQIILESLGGGGHMTIAGARLKDIPIDEAKEKLQHAINEYLREGEE